MTMITCFIAYIVAVAVAAPLAADVNNDVIILT